MKIKEILNLIHDVNPYENFNPKKLNVRSFTNNEFYKKYIEGIVFSKKPKITIEVGSWLGYSAIIFASCMKKIGKKDSGLICIDTWLGSREFWTTKNDKGGWWNVYENINYKTYKGNQYKSLSLLNGYPTLYYDFLSNIVLSDLSNIVVPFPQTSLIAGRWLKSHNIKADLIYIDGSHDYEDVRSDIDLYWSILENDGVIFGDDYDTPDVKKAVDNFMDSKSLKIEINKNFWKIKKNKLKFL